MIGNPDPSVIPRAVGASRGGSLLVVLGSRNSEPVDEHRDDFGLGADGHFVCKCQGVIRDR
jgi:hypothetical protein